MQKKTGKPPERENERFPFLKTLGPGLITGASDDDPSGIGTYSQAGAQFGFATWLDDVAHLSTHGGHSGNQRPDR
jgi:hypothetical protein